MNLYSLTDIIDVCDGVWAHYVATHPRHKRVQPCLIGQEVVHWGATPQVMGLEKARYAAFVGADAVLVYPVVKKRVVAGDFEWEALQLGRLPSYVVTLRTTGEYRKGERWLIVFPVRTME